MGDRGAVNLNSAKQQKSHIFSTQIYFGTVFLCQCMCVFVANFMKKKKSQDSKCQDKLIIGIAWIIFKQIVSFHFGYFNCSIIGCGGTYKSHEGRIYSPGYPTNIPANTECIWKIVQPENATVKITFNSSELSDDATCR